MLSSQAAGSDEVIGRHLGWGAGLQVDEDGLGVGGIGGGPGLAGRTGGYGLGFLPSDRLEGVLRECPGVPPL